jgi:UDP-4-amino-4,6-dideoxy-N-acetyl-beta-L-altrosamine N-acetyltransferase
MTFPERFERHGVLLARLAESDLERVRQWRNDPKIAAQMIDQRHITPEMQAAWFARLQTSTTSCYWVAWFRGQPIGVASLVHVDWEAGTAEPGMYIYPDAFRSNLVPFCVGLALDDLAFEVLGLRRLRASVFETNTAALRFNAACGYVATGEADGPLRFFELTPETYAPARAKMARFLRF